MKHFALLLLLLTLPVLAQVPASDGAKTEDPKTEHAKPDAMKNCSMHDQHAAHHSVVQKHGEQAMGFAQDKTTHHFRLRENGGIIEVSVNDTSDETNRAAIRSHLTHIAEMFSEGNFSAPMFIHDGIPPGVTTMKLTRSAIQYSFEPTETGARVLLKSEDPIAISAIHDFLRFQIAEHETGDGLEVTQK